MVLLPIKPIVIKSSRPARETVKLCLRRSFLFLSFACVLVVCVFGIDNLAFVDERKAGEKTDAFDLMKNEKKDNDRGRRRPGFGLIDSVLRASTATTTKEEIMHEVEEMKYERPSDESSSEDSGGGAFGDIEEEEEEVGKEEDESAKEIDTPSTTTTMDEVKELSLIHI